MKNYRKALCAPVLALALASSAFAGDIQNPIAPPSQRTSNSAVTATDGDIQHPSRAASTSEANTATRVALSLLESLLSVL